MYVLCIFVGCHFDGISLDSIEGERILNWDRAACRIFK